MRIERLLLMIKHRKTKAMETRGESRSVNTEGSQRYGDPSGEPKIEDQKVKQERAQGGCPGTGSR